MNTNNLFTNINLTNEFLDQWNEMMSSTVEDYIETKSKTQSRINLESKQDELDCETPKSRYKVNIEEEYIQNESDESICWELSEDSSSSCQSCGHELVCINCRYESVHDDIPEQLVSKPEMDSHKNICDVLILKDTVMCISETDVKSYSKKDVTVMDYEYVDRAGKNWYPIIQQGDIASANVQMSRYNMKSTEAAQYYGHASGKKMQRKYIVDNQVRCVAPTKYNIIAIDIETYNESTWNQVPLLESSNAHLGLIGIHIRRVSQSGSTQQKHMFIYDNRYNIEKQEDVVIHRFKTEQQCAMGVVMFLAEQQDISFILTFNGSASLFDDGLGYDLPWIFKRSDMKLNIDKKILKFDSNSDQQIRSQCISFVEQLPRCYFIDLSVKLATCTSQDMKNKMVNQSLDSYLEVYGLGSKLEHNYQDLQKRLATQSSDITDLVSYCIRDCTALLELNDTAAILQKMIAITDLLQLPLSYTVYHTDANCIELYLQREYHARGYIVCYYQADVEQKSYKGAYTETVAVVGYHYRNVFCPDFASLYPACIRSINCDLITYQHKGTENSIIVDTSDDDSLPNAVYYSRDNGVIPDLMHDLFEKRKVCKALMKTEKKNTMTYNQSYTMQLALKRVLNTIYGLMGNSKSPLFWIEMAGSVTAYARQSTRTARNIIESHGHQFLFADTDSVFAVLSDDIKNNDQYIDAVNRINKEIQVVMKSQYLEMSVEEIFMSMSFMQGRKSYYGLYIDGETQKNWIRDEQIDPAKMQLKIRGCSWSTMNDTLSKQLEEQLTEFLMSNEDPVQFYDQIKNQTLESITKAIQNHDLETIRIYCKKIKLSSQKDVLVQYLKSCYSSVLEGQDSTYVVELIGSGQATYNKIPLQCIGESLFSRIDIDKLVRVGTSAIRKFMLTDDQKKQDKKQKSGFIGSMGQELTNDQILVRIEKCGVNKTAYKYERWNKNSVGLRIAKMKNSAIHEIISSDWIRLYFDLDSDELTDLLRYMDQLDHIVKEQLGFLPIRRILQSTGCKQSVHVYYDVNVTVQFAKHIASIAHQKIRNVDTAVYGINKSLRMPNSIKIKDNQIVDRRFACSIDLVQNHLICSDTSYPTVHQPLHTMTQLCIDKFYQTDSVIVDEDVQQVQAYLKIQKIDAVVSSQSGFIQINTSGRYMCPIHQREHDSDNMWARANKKMIKIGCFRMLKTEKTHVILPKKKTDTVDLSIIEQLIQDCNNSMNQLQAAIQNNKHLELNLSTTFENNSVVFIRSALGSGKSQRISEYLDQCNDRVLILSHRHTFSADVSKRYRVESYTDIEGSINMNEHKRVICQVESLNRIRASDDCVLILDEIESLLTQINSRVSFQQDAHHHFYNIIRHAKKVVIMDGYLQQQTIQLINWIRNDNQNQIIQNLNAPYNGSTVNVQEYHQHQAQNVLQSVMNKLTHGKRVVCMITSSSLANELNEMVQNNGFTSQLYHGVDTITDDDDMTMYEKKKLHMNDINTHWKVDCLIYTSTITAGVNFDQQHFDTFVHVYSSNTCDALSFVQGCFRVRQFNDMNHELWIQHQVCDIAHSPQQLVYTGDKHYSTQPAEQLLLWNRSRQEAMAQYRSQIVLKSFSELGFKLMYNAKQTSMGRIQNSIIDKDYLMIDVSSVDLENYKLIQQDHSKIGSIHITAEQCKKIAVLQTIGLEPTMDIDQEQSEYIHKNLESLKLNQFITRYGGCDTIEQVLSTDQEARQLGQKMKNIDRTRLSTIMTPFKNLSLYHQYFRMNTWTTDDLSDEVKSDNQHFKKMNQSAACLGYVVDRVSISKSKGQCKYRYTMSKIAI